MPIELTISAIPVVNSISIGPDGAIDVDWKLVDAANEWSRHQSTRTAPDALPAEVAAAVATLVDWAATLTGSSAAEQKDHYETKLAQAEAADAAFRAAAAVKP